MERKKGTLDGTEYYRSSIIKYLHCHHIHHQKGDVSNSHKLITPAFVKPGRGDVLALVPEFILGDLFAKTIPADPTPRPFFTDGEFLA